MVHGYTFVTPWSEWSPSVTLSVRSGAIEEAHRAKGMKQTGANYGHVSGEMMDIKWDFHSRKQGGNSASPLMVDTHRKTPAT